MDRSCLDRPDINPPTDSLAENLLPPNGGVVSLVGAGGKTSLMFRLAGAVAATGASVLTTTTTRIMPPDENQTSGYFLASTAEAVLERAAVLMKKRPHLTVASAMLEDSGKLAGLAPTVIDGLKRSGRFKWILVEADGAAEKQLKAPAGHEPVIPVSTDRLIGVVGLPIIGNPLTPRWVFRPEIYARLTGQPLGTPVTVESIAALILNPDGLFKGSPPDVAAHVFLNLAGDRRFLEQGRRLARRLCRTGHASGIKRVVIGHARDNPAVVECVDAG